MPCRLRFRDGGPLEGPAAAPLARVVGGPLLDLLPHAPNGRAWAVPVHGPGEPPAPEEDAREAVPAPGVRTDVDGDAPEESETGSAPGVSGAPVALVLRREGPVQRRRLPPASRERHAHDVPVQVGAPLGGPGDGPARAEALLNVGGPLDVHHAPVVRDSDIQPGAPSDMSGNEHAMIAALQNGGHLPRITEQKGPGDIHDNGRGSPDDGDASLHVHDTALRVSPAH